MNKWEWILTYVIYPFLAFTLGYFQYGGLDGGLAVLLYDIIIGFASLLGFIPIAGVLLYFMVAKFIITPWVLSFTGITESWVTSLFFFLGLGSSIIATIMSTLFLIAFLED